MDTAKPYLARAVELDKKERGETKSSRLLSGYGWEGSLTWAAMCASARIYESSDIYACIATVKQHSPTPIQLLDNAEQLIYIRRREIADFLLPLTVDTKPYPEVADNELVPYHSPAEHAANLILRMMPEVRAEAEEEAARRVAERGGAALSSEETTALYCSYAANKENWKRIER